MNWHKKKYRVKKTNVRANKKHIGGTGVLLDEKKSVQHFSLDGLILQMGNGDILLFSRHELEEIDTNKNGQKPLTNMDIFV